MREILFRGKQKIYGRWVEGALIQYGEGAAIFDVRGSHDKTRVATVYPETVGQFTGLLDKNGKRIFEGDVIEMDRDWDEKVTYVVRYASDICAFIGSSINYIGFTTFEDDGDRMKIIGNIHDNPELLEDRQ